MAPLESVDPLTTGPRTYFLDIIVCFCTNRQTRDVMSHSYGEGYATRSDEEGFGGTYGGNQSLSHEDEDKIVHGNSPDYDKTQGSEVKEKEKARHQC
ncbi:hypothetical protein HanLR1_Chr11g0386731 [Helianthus annuus]|nr:hypothetical protein HanLR1_Chr11g0386731 [Helianthus annuus]